MKKIIKVKNITLGDGNITVQSMTNTKTSDISATLKQIDELAKTVDLVRLSINNEDALKGLKTIINETNIPIIGDIHFDYRLALGALEAGVHKIRINPSNMPKEHLKEIVDLAKTLNVPIRVGINRGSIIEKRVLVDRLVNLTLDSAKEIEDLGYNNLVLACKSSDVRETVEVYRKLDKLTDYPLHIGLTEAGLKGFGEIKSAIAIGSLLLDGIGDTVRVSLTGNPVDEGIAARKILRAIGKERNFVEIIACPTCSRTEIDVENLAKNLEEVTKEFFIPIKIAVMGCVVNGIGESGNADFGVCGGKEKSAIICNGKIIKTVDNQRIGQELKTLLKNFQKDNQN